MEPKGLTPHYQYHQCLTYKSFLCRKPGEVVTDLDQSLERIKDIHAITKGIQQIVYLVGWQYDGHDSKYPA